MKKLILTLTLISSFSSFGADPRSMIVSADPFFGGCMQDICDDYGYCEFTLQDIIDLEDSGLCLRRDP